VQQAIRPLQYLWLVGKTCPNAWRSIEALWAQRGITLPQWPDWCFLPIAAWQAVLERENRVSNGVIDTRHIAEIAALGTWRYQQAVYRFDPDLAQEIAREPLSGTMPVEVMLRLPQWCVYIETPGQNWLSSGLHGFWAHLEWSTKIECSLWLLLDSDDDGLLPLLLQVGPWTLREAVAKALKEMRIYPDLVKLSGGNNEQRLTEELVALINMLLYLCSDEPDVIPRHSLTTKRPELKRTKNGLRLFPPDKPTVWRVGTAIGETLREARAQGERHESDRNLPRAHIRRGHWHGFWSGTGDTRRFNYKWLFPILVGGRSPGLK
jgi:hypothetical protein